MNRLIIFMFMVIAFSCTKGSQQDNCENEHDTLGDSSSCVLDYHMMEKGTPEYSQFFSVLLLDCLVHNQKLRQCSKKPDYLPAW